MIAMGCVWTAVVLENNMMMVINVLDNDEVLKSNLK